MRKELYVQGEVAAAMKIDYYIKDVDKELVHAEKKMIKLESLGYEISTLLKWSKDYKIKYKEKLGW